MTTQTTYQTPQGKTETGYIIDGRTYKDPEGKQRVGYGSVVDTANGKYIYTPLGGMKTPDNITDTLRQGYDAQKVHLQNAYGANRSAIESATNRQINNLNSQKQDANRRYEDANRAAYGAYVSASNPYGVAEEQRARLGLSNSGFAESSKVNLANTYQTALADNARSKTEYINELERAKINAQYEGDIQLAKALADYENLVYRHGIDAAEAIANAETSAFNAGMDMDERVYRREAEQREAEERRNREILDWALALARSGASNSDIAGLLGISERELLKIVKGV